MPRADASSADRARGSVVVVGPVPPPRHGAAVVTAAMVATLAQHGAVEVVDTSADGAEGVGYHAARVIAHLRACARILRRRRDRPAVYLGGAGGGGLWYQAVVVALARSLGLKVVHHHHSYAYITRYSRAMRLLVRAGGPEAVHVALSEPMRTAFCERYGSDVRSVVCTNAFFVGAPLPVVAVPPRPRLVLGHFGNLTVEKGLGEAIGTFRELVRRGCPVELRLAGPAYGAEEERLIRGVTEEFGARAVWLGPLSHPEVVEFMRGIDLLLFPSRYVNEAQPLTVLEAASAGVPCVAIAHGSVASVVPDPRLLVDADADFPQQAADVVQELGADGGLGGARERTSAMYRELYDESQAAVGSLVEQLLGR